MAMYRMVAKIGFEWYCAKNKVMSKIDDLHLSSIVWWEAPSSPTVSPEWDAPIFTSRLE